MDCMDFHRQYMLLVAQAMFELPDNEITAFMVMIRQTSTETLEVYCRNSGVPMEVIDRMAGEFAGMIGKAGNDLGIEL